MVTLEQLVEWNHDYNLNFGITDEEVKIANEHLKVIDFWQKDAKSPQVGDLVQGLEWGRGHAYECGLIVKIEGEVAEVCYYPYVPFVTTQYAKVQLSCSGGPFTHVHLSCFEPLEGMGERAFKDWGRFGVGGDQAFVFPVNVHKWQLSEKISTKEDWKDDGVHHQLSGSEFIKAAIVPYDMIGDEMISLQYRDGSWFKAHCLGYHLFATVQKWDDFFRKGGKV